MKKRAVKASWIDLTEKHLRREYRDWLKRQNGATRREARWIARESTTKAVKSHLPFRNQLKAFARALIERIKG